MAVGFLAVRATVAVITSCRVDIDVKRELFPPDVMSLSSERWQHLDLAKLDFHFCFGPCPIRRIVGMNVSLLRTVGVCDSECAL